MWSLRALEVRDRESNEWVEFYGRLPERIMRLFALSIPPMQRKRISEMKLPNLVMLRK